MIYAYARVSARDQNLARQFEAFAALNIDRKHIFCDHKSGKDFLSSKCQDLLFRISF